MVPRLVALRRLGGISNLQSGAGLFSAVINANSTERVTPVWLTTHRSGGAWLLGWPVQETMQHLNHVAATRLLRIHGLADQLQLRRLPATKIRSAAGVYEQVQQVVAPAANLLRAAIGEVEDQHSHVSIASTLRRMVSAASGTCNTSHSEPRMCAWPHAAMRRTVSLVSLLTSSIGIAASE